VDQLFRKSANTLARTGFVLLLSLPPAVVAVLMIAVRTPYQTGVGVPRDQPVPFSHEHHAGNLNIDCRYCHHSVEESPFAGMPATEVCMTCHSQLWTNADVLAPVRRSLAFDEPLRWKRLYNLPDYVYFDHSIHVQKGVACESCHGRVDTMPRTYPVTALFMEFCLDCHRRPQDYVRPREQVTTSGWTSPIAQEKLGSALVEEYHINVSQLTDCSICHR
jgi:DNA-directed RNA polymerase subunit RPC12/RpoP